MDDYNQQNYSKVIRTKIESNDLITENIESRNIQSSSLGVIVVTAIVVTVLYTFVLKIRKNSSYQEIREDFPYREISPINQQRPDEYVQALEERKGCYLLLLPYHYWNQLLHPTY